MTFPEDLELLPNGASGTLLLKSESEYIDNSLDTQNAIFAMGLGDDCTPTKSFNYHFTNSSEKFSAFGRLIENEFSEIFWYIADKCLIISGEVIAKKPANITINAPCAVIKDACFVNFDQKNFLIKI